jgi:cytochrome c biogenesis protein CcmG/thiol:disulfide interchange protein DsbE
MNSSLLKSLTVTALLAATVASAQAGLKTGDALPNLADYKLAGTLPDTTGKVVLLDFWASWCGPCGESFPVMDELQKKYGPKGLVIIAVNVDENKSDMDDFLKTHHVSFTVVRDAKQKLVNSVDVSVMPSSFLFGPDGKVAFVHSGFRGTESQKAYETEIGSLVKK